MSSQYSRREFLKISSGSALFTLGFFWSSLPQSLLAADQTAFSPNLWISISETDTVTITMHKSELGQKIWTALPQIIAEELEADWTKIKIMQGNLNPDYGSQTTGGSASIRDNYDKLRRAGATAREMLITAAAAIWKVPRDECQAENGIVHHLPSVRKLTFGALVAAANKVSVPDEVPLKDPRDFKIIGRPFKSVDHGMKIDGSAVFGFDFKLPNMMVGVVERIPVFGGSLADFDPQPALAVPGVKQVFPISSGVVVIAEDSWSALAGRKALKVEWDSGKHADLSSDQITADFRQALTNKGEKIQSRGNADKALKNAAKIVESEFEFPYLDHAPMEPLNCTALVKNGNCEIWVATQNPRAAFGHARHITKFADDKIKVNTLRSGGGFGRRLQSDYVADAVEAAMPLEVPVKIFRTRWEDLKNGTYRPATLHGLKGGMDDSGNIIAWHQRIAGQTVGWTGMLTGGAEELAYDIPNIRTELVMTDVPVPIGAWRSVAHTHNAFVNECFIDLLAKEAGCDPLDFRRELLKNRPRHLGVLNLAAEKSGWGKQPGRHFQGIAVHFSFESYAAVVAEVQVDKSGKLTIHRLICAVDCGTVVNPDGVYAQIEGGVTMGLTAAIHGAITIKDGQVEQSNFHNYKLLAIDDIPDIEGHIVPSTEAPTGIGEPPVPPTPPALANAIFAATGKQITKLPIGGFDLRKAGIL